MSTLKIVTYPSARPILVQCSRPSINYASIKFWIAHPVQSIALNCGMHRHRRVRLYKKKGVGTTPRNREPCQQVSRAENNRSVHSTIHAKATRVFGLCVVAPLASTPRSSTINARTDNLSKRASEMVLRFSKRKCTTVYFHCVKPVRLEGPTNLVAFSRGCFHKGWSCGGECPWPKTLQTPKRTEDIIFE